jgi:reactive intermediate/imine deaminase
MNFRTRAALLIALLMLVHCRSTPPLSSRPAYLTVPERAALDLPYSDAVRVGDLLFLSGTVGTAPGTRRLVAGGVGAETRAALENVKANLTAHGATLDSVVKCSVFLADIADFEAMNGVYREYFPRNKPARTTVGVAGLPLGARVEIECIAAVPRD